MKHPYIVHAFFLCAFLYPATYCNAQGQIPAIQWEKSYGGSSYDAAQSIQQTSDGGYIVAGTSSSTNGDVSGSRGSYDYWIVKLDAAGTITWEKPFGGSANDNGESVQQTTDGGYVVGGYSNSSDFDVSGTNGAIDYWIVKIDNVGNIQWNKNYGGTGDDKAYDIRQTSDGGFIIAGISASNNTGDITGYHGDVTGVGDYWVVKVTSTGAIQWEKALGGGGTDEAKSVQQTTDGGYIVAGNSSSTDGDITNNLGGSDFWVVKLNSSGTIQWQRSLGGSGNDGANSIEQTSDGGYIVAGYSASSDKNVTSNNGGNDYWVVKLDANGSIQWQNSFGGSGDDEATSVQQTLDGGYIVAGWTGSPNDGDVTGFQGVNDYWIIKLDAAGTMQWQKTLGGSGEDDAQCIQQTSDSGYVVAGFSSSTNGDATNNHGGYDYWIAKLQFPPVISSVQQQTFPDMLCGTFEFDTMWVRNTGLKPLVISSVSFSAFSQYYSVQYPSSFPVTVAGGDSVRFIIEFYGSATGTYPTTLDISNNDPAPGHDPWQINVTGTKDSIGFTVDAIAGDTLDFGELACGLTKDTAFTLTNISTHPTTFTMRSGDSTEFTLSQSVAYLANGDQGQYDVHFTGGQPGLYIVPLSITDTCGRTEPIYLKAKVDSSQFAVSALSDTTICPYTSGLTRSVTIRNFSRIPQNIDLVPTGDSNHFQLSPRVFTLAAGDSAVLQISFTANNDTGTFTVSYPLPGCNGAQSVTEMVRVDSIRIAALPIPDTTICPGDSAVRDIIVHNLRGQPQNMNVWLPGPPDARFSFVPDSLSLNANDSGTIHIVFHGDSVDGQHTLSYTLVDACGGGYNFTTTVHVSSQGVQADTIPDTTICPMTKITRYSMLRNVLSSPQHIVLKSDDPLFSALPDSLDLAPGDSAPVAVSFFGSPVAGTYTVHFALPGCGTHAISATVIVQTAFIETQAIPDTTVCPGDSAKRYVWVYNTTNVAHQFQLTGSDPLFSATPDSLNVAAGDSAMVLIRFTGTTALGTYSTTYTLPGCNTNSAINASVNVDTASVEVQSISAVAATLCPGDSAVEHLTLHNISTITQQVILPDNFPFSFSPDTLTIAAGDTANVTLTFRGSADTGTYTESYALPGCGGGNMITTVVNVKTGNIAVPQALSTIVCPNTPATVSFPITNSDTLTRVLTFTDSNCTISKTTVTLAAGATDSLQATFAGGVPGTYICTVHVTDDCGGSRDVTLTINVQTIPPLALALVPDAAPVKVGGEVKMYLTSTPPSSVTGALTFTVANDPQILRFIGVRSLCNANVQSTPRSSMITLSGCPALISDTIAELDYEALAGPTLTTSAQIITAATTNACETVSASGTATLTLLPPSCDIGTINIKPYSTSLGAIYPNPATTAVTVAYTTVEDAPVRIAIADQLGRTVQTLVNGYQQHGTYLAEFDAHGLPNGIYLVTMQEGIYSGAREIMVLK